MAGLKLEVITAERLAYSDEVDIVVAPGIAGQLAILPHHAPLMTMIEPGELTLRKGGQESYLVVTGGFLEVLDDKVVILADAAERADEIDIARAEAAKERAQKRLHGEEALTAADQAKAEAALRRSLVRLKVAERRRRREKPLR